MYINIHQICSVRVYRKHESKRFRYRPKKTILFFWKLEEGYIDDYDVNFKRYTAEQITNGKHFDNLCIENNIVYKKPHVRLFMSNQSYHEKFFESVSELDKFLTDLHFKIPLIDICNGCSL